MVFVNLSKLLLLIQAVQTCPKGIPNRFQKLFQDYEFFAPSSDDVVSVAVKASLERMKESNVDDEEKKRKEMIIFDIISKFTESPIQIPTQSSKIYLISPLQLCNSCKTGALVTVRPSRKGKEAIVYTKNGAQVAELYHKHCTQCLATVYNCYTEKRVDNKVVRKYLDSREIKYFSITTETFFDVELLNLLTEDLFTCDVRISNFVEKYNRLNNSIELNKKRIFHAWLIFSINKRINCVDKNLDIEETCKVLYPELRRCVDAKYLHHICQKCKTRIVVMDGAAKVYRTVCAAKSEKITNFGSLNEFTACSNSPLPGMQYCRTHTGDKQGDAEERLDTGMMTRAKRKELGLDLDFLTTTEGCRKREAITVRTQRSKTAGMLYTYRPCGIALGHMECIHAEESNYFMKIKRYTFFSLLLVHKMIIKLDL